jgi:hypothetical protein
MDRCLVVKYIDGSVTIVISIVHADRLYGDDPQYRWFTIKAYSVNGITVDDVSNYFTNDNELIAFVMREFRNLNSAVISAHIYNSQRIVFVEDHVDCVDNVFRLIDRFIASV